MRLDKTITRWVSVPALGLAMGLTACFNSQESGSPTNLPDNPLDSRIAKAMQRTDGSARPAALAKSATVFASGTDSVKRVFMETVYLGDGDQFEWYTN